MTSTNSSLRPAWRNSSGGRGFQPPPSVASERGRSQSIGSSGDNSAGENRASTYNKFSALDDDEDGIETAAERPPPPKGNSRSEALRQGLGSRSSSIGKSSMGGGGRRLADLAATAPERPGYTATGRFAPRPAAVPIDEGKIIRFTRERLLSMRPAPNPVLPLDLKPLEGNVIISETPQDPVCWDTFNADEIWAAVPRRPSKPAPAGRSLSDMAEGAPPARGRRDSGSTQGRWQRGVALPPPSAAEKARKDKEAENPDDLWDDPMSAPAMDFSAFGDVPKEEEEGAFDFEKMAEESKMLEDELHGRSRASSEGTEQDGNGANIPLKSVDPHRPLASIGTTIRSGSGDDVNVFEDFDEPNSSDSTPTPAEPETNKEASAKGEAPNNPTPAATDDDATSRLMAMIGVSSTPATSEAKADSNAAETKPADEAKALSSSWGEPSNQGVEGLSIPLNPWGGPLLGTSSDGIGGGSLLQPSNEAAKGLDLQSRLREAEIEQEKSRQAELERRRMEEAEAKKRAAELQQRQQVDAQRQQQQAGVQNQVELVLMERISNILENSWGRSDLVSVLSTLHAEDSRVIALLNSIEALRALIMRHSSRVSLRQDPAFGAEMAVLVLTNAQWQQHQQEAQQQRQARERAQQQQQAQEQALRAQQQQEELRRREQQRLQEEQRKQQTKAVVPGAPWYYSDPQQNIQGPFRGEEMRQWLEAGYFKGDLPVSQDAAGPFRPLSAIYPDLSMAFMSQDTNSAEEQARRAAEELERERAEAEIRARKLAEAEEKERKEREAALEAEAVAERVRLANEQAAAQAAAAAEAEAAEPEPEDNEDGNESSAQLKLMLGLSAQQQAQGQAATSEPKKEMSPKKSKGKKAAAAKVPQSAPDPMHAEVAQPLKPAASAWGAANNKTVSRKSMSEIQQEEARIAAKQAMERQRSNPSSGWANVAASSKSGPTVAKPTGPGGWNNAAAKLTPAVVVTKPGQVKTTQAAKPSAAARSRSVPVTSSSQAASAKQTSAAGDDFGAKMSPALEKWCKDQMIKLNGSDDLTLLSFCMTLTDPNEIRQYLVTYLGTSPQVNSFANEFIQRKSGVKPVKEEWETTVSTKKKGKKKGGGR
eukprot:CAMPEP_0168738414 /NCGR_PEP_ID=MMETSP0724-20121128/10919_1 /TAXON_ID=265536 /ORGANISM="Amphiprora sp., Strain CCMP467" /LENGTH=1104 /DNA_ID=CAMNT_0008785753 /DNA_START=77 /DNA_END=3391 /DNA_ORIENTATION=+